MSLFQKVSDLFRSYLEAMGLEVLELELDRKYLEEALQTTELDRFTLNYAIDYLQDAEEYHPEVTAGRAMLEDLALTLPGDELSPKWGPPDEGD